MLSTSSVPLSNSAQTQLHGLSVRICKPSSLIPRLLECPKLSTFNLSLQSRNIEVLTCTAFRIQRKASTSRQCGRTSNNLSKPVAHCSKVQCFSERSAEKVSENLRLHSRGFRRTRELRVEGRRSSQLIATRLVDESEPVLAERKTNEERQDTERNNSKKGTQRLPESTSVSEVQPEDRPSGSLLGAVALITGTSVGAGILALPGITAPAGFVPATSIMVACWSFLVGEALLLAEVNVELLKQVAGQDRASDVLSLRTMAQKTLGPTGGAAATLAYVFLTYTLLTAYVAKSADVLSLLLGLPAEWSGVTFVGFFGAVLLIGGTIFTDYLNQAATAVMITLFLVMVGGGSFFADWSILEQADWKAAPAALPIIFLSLVYHDLTPVICSYLGGDIHKIRQAIILGSLVPLLMFISCNAVALAISPITGGGDPLNIMIRLGGPGPAAMIETFSLLAITTSFIGTVLGATEFALEQFGGLHLAGRQAPRMEAPSSFVNTVDIYSPSARQLPPEGSKVTFPQPTISSQEGVGDASVQDEIDRLQKRVNAKLQQWDARFKRDRAVGRSENGHRGDTYNVGTSVEVLEDNMEGQPSLVNDLNVLERLVAGDSSIDNQDLDTRVRGRNDVLQSTPILKSRSSASQSKASIAGSQKLNGQDAASGGLWSTESLQTGTVNWGLRAGAFVVVLVPPVLVASQYPDAFFQASNIAGAYGMTTLYGFFPVAMAWSMRTKVKRRRSDSTNLADYQVLVPGGRFTLVLMGLCAAGVMGGQAALDSKLAAGALTDLLTRAEPALEAMQEGTSRAASALAEASVQVWVWEEGSQLFQGGRSLVQKAVEEATDLPERLGLPDSASSLMQEGASQAARAMSEVSAQVGAWEEGSDWLQDAKGFAQTAAEGVTGLPQRLGLPGSARRLMQEGATQAGSALAEVSSKVKTWKDGSDVLQDAKVSVQTAVERVTDLPQTLSLREAVRNLFEKAGHLLRYGMVEH